MYPTECFIFHDVLLVRGRLTNPVGVEQFSYINTFFCSNKFTWLLSTWVKTGVTRALTNLVSLWLKTRSYRIEYRYLLMAWRRSITYRCWKLREIINLRDTDKSRYFVITDFNNWFFFFIRIKQSAIQSPESVVTITHEQNLSKAHLDVTTHEQRPYLR